MKKLLLFVVLTPVLVLILQPSANCLPTAYSTIQSASVTNGKYTFEMWGNSSDRSPLLSEIQWALKFNSAALDTNSLVVTFTSKYSAFVPTWHALSSKTQLVLNLKLPDGVPPIHLTDLTPGEKVCSVTMDIKQPSATANLSFQQSDYYERAYNLGFVGYGFNLFNGGDNSPLPIQLASFTASAINSSAVTLTWTTISEVNNLGFYVQRDGVDIAFVVGNGTTLRSHTYAHMDNPERGRHTYRLKQIDLDGTTVLSESVVVNVTTPSEFALVQNYPNPFNPSTTIRYGVPNRSYVLLVVLDPLGQLVTTLVNGDQEAGYHEVRFDASGLASGMYFFRIQAGSFVQSKKMLVVR